MMRNRFLSTVIVAMTAGIVAAQSPSIGEPSVIMTTPNPALGSTVYFAVTVPKTLAHEAIRVDLWCSLDTREVVYNDSRPWNDGFVLGGTNSRWLTVYPTQPVHCLAEEVYWSKKGGSLQRKWLASSTFDATGQ